MTLHLYFARKFLASLAIVFLLFFLIMLMLGVVDQIRRFDIGTISFAQAIGLAALHTPASLYKILPLIVLLATLTLFLGLARSSELVIARASGRSALRSLMAPVLACIAAGGVTVAVFNPLVAATAQEYEALSNRYSQGSGSVLSISPEGLWLRQGDAGGQMVIRAAHTNTDGTVLQDVTFLAFGPDAAPLYRVEAARAALTAGAWQLSDAKRWPLDDPSAIAERQAQRFETLTVPSDLTRERIRDSFGSPSDVPIWQLPDFIAELERAGFSALQHRVWFQMELALPAFYVAMMLIAAGFTMRHTRFARTGPMVMLALGLGLALFFLRNFVQLMGESGQIPVALAAWSPPAIGIFLSLGLLLHLEDG